jgi:hypothetical protein
MIEFEKTEEFKRGRTGEILQFVIYRNFGMTMLDVADRTHGRAPMLYCDECKIISADSIGSGKNGGAQIEFKVKTAQMHWRGGSPQDNPRVSARNEHGIDRIKFHNYLKAQEKFGMPLVLSILCVETGTMIAATLEELGEPRFSSDKLHDLVSWDVRSFKTIAKFGKGKLFRLFTGSGKAADLRERWSQKMPDIASIQRVIKWLDIQERELPGFAGFRFDQIEHGWHGAMA